MFLFLRHMLALVHGYTNSSTNLKYVHMFCLCPFNSYIFGYSISFLRKDCQKDGADLMQVTGLNDQKTVNDLVQYVGKKCWIGLKAMGKTGVRYFWELIKALKSAFHILI